MSAASNADLAALKTGGTTAIVTAGTVIAHYVYDHWTWIKEHKIETGIAVTLPFVSGGFAHVNQQLNEAYETMSTISTPVKLTPNGVAGALPMNYRHVAAY